MEILSLYIPAWLVLVALSLFLAYIYSTWTFATFSRQGIPGPKPWPLVGNTRMLAKMGTIAFQDHLHKTYGRVVGIFDGRLPVFYVTDSAMLKQVMVKDFSNFTNRRDLMSDYPLNSSLPVLLDDVWRRVRNQMTPAFSSGKLKQMTQSINDCANILVTNTGKVADKGNVELRKLTNAFTMDVICRVAFGLQVDSQQDPDNPFVSNVKGFAKANVLWVMIHIAVPWLYTLLEKLFKITTFPKSMLNFFCEVTEKLIEERKQQENIRPDILHLMMKATEIEPDKEDVEEDNDIGFKYQASAKGKKGMSKHELMGNTLIFFLAGSETTSNTLTYFMYSMACNPEFQKRLTEEIDDIAGNEEIITTEMTKKMHYLDMCLQETLRMYPVGVRVERMCSKDTQVGEHLIPKGTMVAIPIRTIHHDAEYWPDPETFNPERFTPEAKATRDPLTYIPFGFGPRNCIGMRLALMELKITAVKLLQKFQFQTCSETPPFPITYAKWGMLVPEVGPIKLNVVER